MHIALHGNKLVTLLALNLVIKAVGPYPVVWKRLSGANVGNFRKFSIKSKIVTIVVTILDCLFVCYSLNNHSLNCAISGSFSTVSKSSSTE